MDALNDGILWFLTHSWSEIWQVLKQLHDYRELALLVLSCVTAIALMFVGRKLKRMLADIKREVGAVKESLGSSSQSFKADMDGSIGKLNQTMEATLDRVDMAGDAMAKKLDFAKKELEGAIEEAVGRWMLQNGRATPAPVEKVDHWDKLRELWENTKKEIEERIAKVVGSLSDGRRRRRYTDMDRRDYQTVILKLYEDNWIDDVSVDALLEMNLMYTSRRNRKRPVSHEDLAQFTSWRKQWVEAAQVIPAELPSDKALVAAE